MICNVHYGGWVLAYGYSGYSILVNDPGYSTTSYALSQIVEGNSGVYRVGNGNFFEGLVQSIDSWIHRDSTALMEIADGGELEEEQQIVSA